MKADLKCETTDLLQSRQKGMWRQNYPYLAKKAECYWRSRSSDFWQSRLSESAEAKLDIFGSPGRDEMQKRNFTSLEVLAEQVRKAELQIFASQDRAEVREQNFTYLAVKAERKCGSGTSHFWQSVQNESADVELQIFGS